MPTLLGRTVLCLQELGENGVGHHDAGEAPAVQVRGAGLHERPGSSTGDITPAAIGASPLPLTFRNPSGRPDDLLEPQALTDLVVGQTSADRPHVHDVLEHLEPVREVPPEKRL